MYIVTDNIYATEPDVSRSVSILLNFQKMFFILSLSDSKTADGVTWLNNGNVLLLQLFRTSAKDFHEAIKENYSSSL